MRLTATHKPSAKAIEILGVHGITEQDGIYYIEGEYEPRCGTIKPLTVMHGGSILFKARNIELDDRVFYSLELSK